MAVAPAKPVSKTLELIKKITSQATDEEALLRKKEEQDERLRQIKVMMDEEKKAKATAKTEEAPA